MKPVLKVYLLPGDWGEARYQDFHKCLVSALAAKEGYFPNGVIKTEDDLITIFPKDCMVKGLGTEIHAEFDYPTTEERPWEESDIAVRIGKAIKNYFPNAYVQCKIHRFNHIEGRWHSKMKYY